MTLLEDYMQATATRPSPVSEGENAPATLTPATLASSSLNPSSLDLLMQLQTRQASQPAPVLPGVLLL